MYDDFRAYANVYVATEDGGTGSKGTVMHAIEDNGLKGDVIFACGPMPMLRAIKKFAEDNNISRSEVEIMERFFLRYNIPITTDGGGRNTMRRLLQRWREEAERLYKAPTIIGYKLITRIDEHERRGGLPKYH